MGVDRPPNYPPGVGVEHHAAADFAFLRRVLGDVRVDGQVMDPPGVK
jgi:hypothetical protein